MKKFIAFLLIFTCIFFVACSTSKVKQGEITEDGFIDPETGIEYVYCESMRLFPLEPYDATNDEDLEPDLYITLESDLGTENFYPVWFEDPTEFLCYKYSDFYYLVRNKEIKEPTIREFNPIAAQIYDSSNTVYIASFYADDEYLPDEKQDFNVEGETYLCQLMMEQLSEGDNIDVPVTDQTIQDLYYFHFLSTEYPGLYYQIAFFGYNGRYFLRDSSTNTTVYCPRDVILRMVGEE